MGTFVSRVNVTLFSGRIKIVIDTIRKSLLVSKSSEDFSYDYNWKPAIKKCDIYGIPALASFDKFKCDDIMTPSPL